MANDSNRGRRGSGSPPTSPGPASPRPASPPAPSGGLRFARQPVRPAAPQTSLLSQQLRGGPPQPGPSPSTGLTFQREPVAGPSAPRSSMLGRLLSAGPAPPDPAAPSGGPAAPAARPMATGRPVTGYLHMTDSDNAPAIRARGLQPRERTGVRGIGPPGDGGDYHAEGVYVVDDPGLYRGDTRETNIGVVSARRPTQDTNYPHSPGFTRFGAGYFDSDVPPLRQAMQGEHDADTPYSFALPMTPRTQVGAQRLLQATEGRALSPRSAGDTVASRVRDRYPLHFHTGEADLFGQPAPAPEPTPGGLSPSMLASGSPQAFFGFPESPPAAAAAAAQPAQSAAQSAAPSTARAAAGRTLPPLHDSPSPARSRSHSPERSPPRSPRHERKGDR